MNYKEFNKGCFEEAKRLYRTANADQRYVLEKLFPELVESEDEKIREKLINTFNFYDPAMNSPYLLGINRNDIVAWLEKQGEQKNKINSCKITFEDVLALECAMKTIKITKGCAELYKILVPLYDKIHNAYLVEKQGKQKEPQVYKTKDDEIITYSETNGYKVVEPKFKVGDWVVNKLGNIWHIDSFDAKNYQVTNNKGEHNYFPIDIQDRMHLWTINDAKPGDILELDSGIGIFKDNCIDSHNIHCYCYYSYEDVLEINKDSLYDNYQSHPATKEQCDTLMKAITDAGYTFDFEKKELKKIEENSFESDSVVKAMRKAGYEWSEETHLLKKIEQKPS